MRYKIIALHTATYAIVDESDDNRIVAKAGSENDANTVAEGLNLVEDKNQYYEEMARYHDEVCELYFDDAPF